MVTPDLELWQVELDGLRMGAGTRFGFRREGGSDSGLVGLTELEVRDADEDNPVGDGVYEGLDTIGARTITMRLDVDGSRAGSSFDDDVAALEWATRPKRVVDFWAWLPTWSTPRRASVRVRRRRMPTDIGLRRGHTYVDVQLKASDPVLYGPEPTGLVTGFPVQVGGLQHPLFTNGGGVDLGYLDYGAAPVAGRLVVANAGTADVAPRYDVVGPVPAQGFSIVRTDTGAQLTFEGPLAAGAHLVLDAADGAAIVDGTADRGGQLTYRDFWAVGPGESVELAFLNLGAWSAAQLTVHAPSGWW